eukprot:602694-Pelagomonas_calceolata.AAC.1
MDTKYMHVQIENCLQRSSLTHDDYRHELGGCRPASDAMEFRLQARPEGGLLRDGCYHGHLRAVR